MTVLAVLQNQWFRDPERWRERFARCDSLDERASLVSRCLFAGCTTGHRLNVWLGDELCGRIVWENSSAHIGGHSSSGAPADPEHLVRIIEHHKPVVVWTFGKIAYLGVAGVPHRRWIRRWQHVDSPHPAARFKDTESRVRDGLRRVLEIERGAEIGTGLFGGVP